MYQKITTCPACEHTEFKNYLISKDYSVSQENFALVKCCECKLIFTNPRPSSENLGNYYKSDAYISHTDKANSLTNLVYKLVRSYTLRSKRKLIEKRIEKGKIFDFGCGTGDFLRSCKNNGWEISGLEIDKDARAIARKKNNFRIYSMLEELDKKPNYDVITAWHVIEHVEELKPTLKLLRKKLRKDGLMFVALPNIQSYDSKYYKEFWAGLDTPRHLYHFAPKTFIKLARSLKFKVIDQLPMLFDSYYVSLLSEQYKGNKAAYLKALQTGWKSNKDAKLTGNYSSIIYVLKK